MQAASAKKKNKKSKTGSALYKKLVAKRARAVYKDAIRKADAAQKIYEIDAEMVRARAHAAETYPGAAELAAKRTGVVNQEAVRAAAATKKIRDLHIAIVDASTLHDEKHDIDLQGQKNQ